MEQTLRLVAEEWAGPCASDLGVMVLTGLLGHLVERWCGREPSEVLPSLLEGVVVRSDEPSRMLWTLSQQLGASRPLPDFASWKEGLSPEASGLFERVSS